MGDKPSVLLIVLVCMVAVFVLLRLRSVLGRTTDVHEVVPLSRDEEDMPPGPDPAAEETGTPPGIAEEAVAGIADITRHDRNFDPSTFVAGARAAHETIIHAFSSADMETLRALLDEEILGRFSAVISGRSPEEAARTVSLLAIRDVGIVAACVRNRVAEITVHFDSEIMTTSGAVPGSEGGDRDEARSWKSRISENWTFTKKLRDSGVNWRLVSIHPV